MRSFLLLAITILLFSLQGCIFNNNKNSDQAIDLKLNFNPSHTYKFIKESKDELHPEIKGNPITITENMTIEGLYQITPANNGHNIAFSFNRIAIQSGNGLITLEYDSKDPSKQGQEIFHNIPNVLNKQRNATIGADGRITIVPQSEIADTSATEGQLTDFSDSSVKTILDQFFNFYPHNPVKLGDTWKTTSDVYVGFIKTQAENTYKLTAITGNAVHIEINSNLISQSVDTNGKHFRGIQTGEMDVDINSGLITDCKLSRQIEGFMDNQVHTTVKSDIHITGHENK